MAAGISVAGLLVLAIPAFSLHTANAGVSGLPKDMPIVHTFDRIQAAFPGGVEPAEVAISAADVKAPPVAHAVKQLREEIARRPRRTSAGGQAYRVAADGKVAELQGAAGRRRLRRRARRRR